jgi:acetyltransferase-like isoleucine patch superfamily enzyme
MPARGAYRFQAPMGMSTTEPSLDQIPDDAIVMHGPAPLHGGPIVMLRFMLKNRLFRTRYLGAYWRMFKHKVVHRRAYGRKIHLNGLAFVGKNVKIEIGPLAHVYLDRWCWVGNGTKLRAHGGEIRIGSKSVLGEEITFSTYEHISIGRECIIADRVMFIDFDHKIKDVEQAIRKQGVYSKPVRVGNNVWIGYGASILRGVTIGDGAVIGTHAVVTKDVPPNAIVGGVPAKVIRMRDEPQRLRWDS